MIRVLIERHLAEGMDEDYRQALREMRNYAAGFPGYIEGESLRAPADPHHYFVITSWRTLIEWDNWVHSEARQLVLAKIGPMLEEPEKITVLERM